MELDPKIKALATAIKKQESGTSSDPYNAKGASGEHGAYQFMPNTWKAWAGKHLGDANAPLTVENQNKVAYNQIKEWKDKGYNPAQIAAAWNAGEGSVANDKWKTNVGTNTQGVKYDTPSYVKNVSQYYREKSAEIDGQPKQSPINYGEMTPSTPINQESLGGKIVRGLGGSVYDPAAQLGMEAANRAIGPAINAMGGDYAQVKSLPSFGNITGREEAPRVTAPGYDENGNPVSVGKELEKTAGAFGQTALNVGTLGAGGVAKGALANVGERNGLALLKSMGIGGGYGATNAMSEGGDVGDVLQQGAVGTALGAGLGMLPIVANVAGRKLSGLEKVASDLQAARKAGDTAKIAEITSSDAYKKAAQAHGLTDTASIQAKAQQERDDLSKFVQEADVTTDKAGVVSDRLKNNIDNEGDNAIRMVMEDYNAGDSFDAIGNRIKSKATTYGENLNKITSEITKSGYDPIRTISKNEFIADAIAQLPTEYQAVNGVAGNAPLREKAIKFLEDSVNTNLDNGALSFNKLDAYRRLGNQSFGSDAFTANMENALARASRNTVAKVTEKVAGAGDDVMAGLLKQYTEYNKLHADSKLAVEAAKVIHKLLRDNPSQVISKGAGFLAASMGENALSKTANFIGAKKISDVAQRRLARAKLEQYMGGAGTKLNNTIAEQTTANTSGLIEKLRNLGKRDKSVGTLMNTLERNKRKLLPVPTSNATGKTMPLGAKTQSKADMESLSRLGKTYEKVPVKIPLQLGTGERQAISNTPINVAPSTVADTSRGFTGSNPLQTNLRGMSTPETLAATAGVATAAMEGANYLQNKYGKDTYTNEQSTPEVTPKQGVIDGIDISKYATDPAHEVKVQKIHESMPTMSTSSDAQSYIDDLKSRNGMNTKVTGDMIYKAAKEYGVSMKLMMALMQNDSMFGTTGLGRKTNNPGNIANDDAGHKQYYPTMREGVRAVARQLARYKVAQSKDLTSNNS